MKLTDAQKQLILDALDMAEKSHKRMQGARPQFAAVAAQIRRDIEEVAGIIRAVAVETPLSTKK